MVRSLFTSVNKLFLSYVRVISSLSKLHFWKLPKSKMQTWYRYDATATTDNTRLSATSLLVEANSYVQCPTQ